MSIFLSFRALLAASAASLLLVAAGSVSAQTFQFTAIADESPTELQREAAPLVSYLEKKLAMKVEFTPENDYAVSVEALVNKQVKMAWFGGFTFVHANVRSAGNVLPIVQREEDEKFRSVFITAETSINSLAELKGKTMSFGSQSSTSAHLMPPGAALDC